MGNLSRRFHDLIFESAACFASASGSARNLSAHTGASAAMTASSERSLAILSAVRQRPATPVKANKHRCDGTGGCALQQTLPRFFLQNCRYSHGISFRPTCFGARTRTPGWVPVQHVEMKTERFAMAYRLILGLRLCPPEFEQNCSHPTLHMADRSANEVKRPSWRI